MLRVMQLAHFDFLILFQYTNEDLDDLQRLVAQCLYDISTVLLPTLG